MVRARAKDLISNGRRVKGKRPKDSRHYSDPKWEYIYSPELPTLEQLARTWKGIKGCSDSHIKWRCGDEGWKRLREDHWNRVDKEVVVRQQHHAADRREKQIEDATDRHIQSGQAMQGVAGFVLKKAHEILKQVEDGAMDPIKALRAVAQLMPKGVEIERKGLGIADKFVVAYHTKEITQKVLLVIQKWVKEPAVYENITRDMVKIESDARAEVDELLETKS